jgi:hypothetical protein
MTITGFIFFYKLLLLISIVTERDVSQTVVHPKNNLSQKKLSPIKYGLEYILYICFLFVH